MIILSFNISISELKYNTLFNRTSQLTTFLDFGLGRLTSSMLILIYEAGFYKPTILKVHPPISRITAHVTMPVRLEHSIIYFVPRY
jgi:hypothetical protein